MKLVRNLVPGVGLELLHTERDALAAVLELQDHRVDVLADLQDLVDLVDALARDLAHVDEAFDPVPDVDEGAERLDAGDLTLDLRPGLERANGGRERLEAS